MKNDLVRRRILALTVTCIILAGSSIPGKNIPAVFSLTPDKLIHCAEYAVLGFFLFRWLCAEYVIFSLSRISVLTLLLGLIMGVIDENYQRLIPGRTPDFWDWILDSIGVFLAVALTNFLINSGKINR